MKVVFDNVRSKIKEQLNAMVSDFVFGGPFFKVALVHVFQNLMLSIFHQNLPTRLIGVSSLNFEFS